MQNQYIWRASFEASIQAWENHPGEGEGESEKEVGEGRERERERERDGERERESERERDRDRKWYQSHKLTSLEQQIQEAETFDHHQHQNLVKDLAHQQ